MGFTSLAYLMDLQWLTEAYHRTRKTGATGVDGQTWHEYGQNLEANLRSLLEPIYEQDFVDGSYGFRPGRGAHDALERLWRETMNADGGWVLEVDISKFFDTLDHGHLRQFVQHRVRDGVLLRLIGKWLNAGVMESGQISYPEEGSPQGGVISPLLANVYLHYVLDMWFEQEVQPRLAGRAYLIRYAPTTSSSASRTREMRIA
ncbi:MAG TPA: reverse transcriptase domain-containing protein [Tepidisphaeraceae bacterium]|jgi:retron-type reverse transcriptase